MLTIKIIGKGGKLLMSESGTDICAHYDAEYSEGDVIRIESAADNYVFLKLDEAVSGSIVLMPHRSFEFSVPFGGVRAACFGNEAFSGDSHVISAHELPESEIYAYRNIALNPYDCHGRAKGFPHATANFVTREEPCFYERNAIDGVCQNESHGGFPYHSWAGGAREDLDYRIDFGGETEVD